MKFVGILLGSMARVSPDFFHMLWRKRRSLKEQTVRIRKAIGLVHVPDKKLGRKVAYARLRGLKEFACETLFCFDLSRAAPRRQFFQKGRSGMRLSEHLKDPLVTQLGGMQNPASDRRGILRDVNLMERMKPLLRNGRESLFCRNRLLDVAFASRLRERTP
jgi:hypothetical protein